MTKRTPNRQPKPARPDQQLLTIAQVTLETGVPGSSVRDLIARGALPFVRLGDVGRLWIRRADISQLIEKSTDRRAS